MVYFRVLTASKQERESGMEVSNMDVKLLD
jgi:hypothetical protein